MSDIQRDREERQHVIEVLKSWDGYFIGYTSDEVQEALRYAINSIKTDLKYDLLYEETSGQADKPTTKNDLGVDCISRADVLKLMQDNWHTHNGDWAMQESMDDIRALPAVTPQEPILDKIRAEIKPTRKMYFEMNDVDWVNGCDYVLAVIDKYKAESEG